MNLFNEEGRIMNFKNVEDILKYWFDIRLAKYNERKVYLIGKIENELDLLRYKAMFIEFVIDEKIIIFKKKKNEIIQKLEELNFPRLSNTGEDKSYDYITSIPLFNLTEEKIEELNNKLKEKEKELEYVKVTTPIQMWKIELKELLKEYNTWFDLKEKEFNNNIAGEINISKLNKKTDIKKKNKVKKL
jgi:DNA topoisomerase-2